MKQTLWLVSLILVLTLTACAERIPVGTAVPGVDFGQAGKRAVRFSYEAGRIGV